jgi:hypothetical protein
VTVGVHREVSGSLLVLGVVLHTLPVDPKGAVASVSDILEDEVEATVGVVADHTGQGGVAIVLEV